METIPIPTKHGTFVATFSERGLASLDFPKDCATAEAMFPDSLAHWAKLTENAINCLLSGRIPPELPPLDISGGTPFQQNVWKALQAIPLGETATYSEVAGQLGKPAAVRAVGRACGANPIPVLIPCHRVLAKGSRIGGFSAGLEWKRILLAREGIEFVES